MTSNQTRFFVRDQLIAGRQVRLSPDSSHKILSVLRLSIDDEIFVFDPSGVEYKATIESLEKKIVTISLAEKLTTVVESPLQIILIMAVIRGGQMDYSLQKATELGVNIIMPFFSERTIIRINAERQAKRQIHWQNILQSATEQCGRRCVPDLHPLRPLSKLKLSELKADCLLLDPYTKSTINETKIPEGPLAIICGPEGGFSKIEIRNLREQGAMPVNLGPRILRAETASTCALSIAQYVWGDTTY